MKSRTLHIPFNPELDNLMLPDVANAMEEKGTRLSVDSLNWPKEFPYRPLTVITAAHSGTHLYIDFLVRCNYLRAENYTDNSPVSEDSCVEIYLQPDPTKERYLAVELNCIGSVNALECDEAGVRTPLEAEVLKEIKRYSSVGTRPFQEVEGSFIWSVTTVIPLSIIGVEYDGEPLEMKGNFNKCASATSQPHYLSWMPIQSPAPDFHRPECFGSIILD